MKGIHFDQLTESLQQAITYKKGNHSAARTTVRVLQLPQYKAEDIVTIRRKLDLTQKDLAAVIGVSPRTVEAWEAGANAPSGAASRLLYLLGKDKSVLTLLEA